MKTPKRIKVIASAPRDNGQCGIENLIGKEYDVVLWDEEEKQVSVTEADFDGQIVLNESEFQVIA